MPCVPPNYSTELHLLVKGTEVYVPTQKNIEIIEPKLTHLIVNNQMKGSYLAAVFVDPVWPENSSVQCIQTTNSTQKFVSTLSDGKCELVVPYGNLTL